jgi:hypothetical protein
MLPALISILRICNKLPQKKETDMPPEYFEPDTREVLREYGPARLEIRRGRAGGKDREIPVLHVQGDYEEMGRQYGCLTGDYVCRQADRILTIFTGEGISPFLARLFMDRAWKRLRPHVPPQYLREMAAIAEGAREAGFRLALRDLERIMAVTNLDMYRREERFLEIIAPKPLAGIARKLSRSVMPAGTPAPMSCTMFAVWGSRTVDGKCFSIRNLDWLSQSGMHEDRLITVYRPDGRNAFVTMGYAGVTGALAGMNDQGIALSEVGAFSVSEEQDGTPWAFIARRVLEESDSLEDAADIIKKAKHTLGYNYLIADGDPENFGKDAFQPCAASFETNFSCCEVFYENDEKERAAVWIDPDGEKHFYGVPLKEATLRADTDFGASTRALQAADDGPGEAANLGNPWGGADGDSTYVTCHLPMHDMICAYEKGEEYIFPVRDTKVIEAGEPRKIGPVETLNIAATVAHNTEKLHENDWNVMSIAYAPTDLVFWAAWETRDNDGNWLNAPDSGYFHFDLKELLREKA